MKKIQIIAILAALFTAITVYFFLGSLKEASKVPMVPVVVSSMEIKENTEIKSDMVKIINIAESAVTPNAVTKLEEVVGNIATRDIYTGEQIILQEVAKPGESKQKLSYMIEAGKRAVSVKVDEVSGISGLIEPGNKVDVVVVYDESSTSEIILQDIVVLSTGMKLETEESAKSQAYETVTLSLDTNQILKLRVAEAKGEITMALMSYLEN
ncbi:MAG: Flp pilus assembly protein CpaB [Proteocatella sp.]